MNVQLLERTRFWQVSEDRILKRWSSPLEGYSPYLNEDLRTTRVIRGIAVRVRDASISEKLRLDATRDENVSARMQSDGIAGTS